MMLKSSWMTNQQKQMEKDRLKSIFAQFKTENNTTKDRNSRVLVIDGLNMFIRSFMASPLMNEHGTHIGGTVGFVKSLFSVIRHFRPTRCVLIFDGKDGGARRRKRYPEYKAGRRNRDRLNRVVEDGSLVEGESFTDQFNNMEYLINTMPLTMMSIDFIEADDVIGYIAKDYYKANDFGELFIVSADKDFIQLVDTNISVYSPIKRILYNPTTVVKEFGLSAYNYLTFRVFDGDDSDNIVGVKGIGLKTFIKFFPEVTERNIDPLEIIEIAKLRIIEGSKRKTYQTVVDSEEQILLNWYLMDLSNADIPSNKKFNIKDIMDSDVYQLDKLKLKKLIYAHRLNDHFKHFDSLIYSSLTQLNLYAEAE